MTSLHLSGQDTLDVQLDGAALAAPRRTRDLSQRRRFAGWSASSLPVASLLLVGIALGPQGLNLLSLAALSLVDPAIPVALAALGVLVGLSLNLRRESARPLAGAAIESALTAGFVGGGFYFLAPHVPTTTPLPFGLLALALAFCAGTSLGIPGANPTEPRPLHNRVMELDVLGPLLCVGLLLALVTTDGMIEAITLVSKATVIALLLALAGWLLLTAAVSDTEQRVFAFATMLLLGGAADYLSLSALLAGFVAGTFWQLAGGPADASLRRDAEHVQHSLFVLVLVVAGAHAEVSLISSALAAVFVFWRTAGKMIGAVVARPVAGASNTTTFALQLLSPGVFGVALALNIVRAVGQDAALLLTIVVLGTIGFELVAELWRPRERERHAGGLREDAE
jgi:hypothetical protein